MRAPALEPVVAPTVHVTVTTLSTQGTALRTPRERVEDQETG